jgi:hypothetical protein
MDAKRRLAGVSALARWNLSRGEWRSIAAGKSLTENPDCEVPCQPCEEVQPRGRCDKDDYHQPGKKAASFKLHKPRSVDLWRGRGVAFSGPHAS